MPITDGKISIYYAGGGGTTIEVPTPEYPYTCRISMPIESVAVGSGVLTTYDPGAAYDTRQCECDIVCTSTEASTLMGLIWTTARTADSPGFTITMNTSSGFYPFGPDKGDVGPFGVQIQITGNEGVGPAPYLYHRVSLLITKNSAAYPAYSLPTEVDDGTLLFGTVTKLRFPPEWYKPTPMIGLDVSFRHTGRWEEHSTGTGGDRYDTSATFHCNQSKAAALVAYVTGTARGTVFASNVPANSYAFGSNLANSGVDTMRLSKHMIDCQNTRNNEWRIPLSMTLDE